VKPSDQKTGTANSGKGNKLHCLITGFDAFGGDAFNPSQAIVESLPETIKSPGKGGVVPVDKLVLPTCGDLAWRKLKGRLQKLPKKSKSVVILTGLAALRPKISVERFALNIKDYRVKDNAGCLINGEAIDPRGPAALRTPADVKAIVKHVFSKGLFADVSNSCGTFVCNEIYFQGLRFQKAKGFPHALVFVHFPWPGKYRKRSGKQGASRVQKLTGSQSKQLLAMQKTLIEIAQFLLKQAIKNT